MVSGVTESFKSSLPATAAAAAAADDDGEERVADWRLLRAATAALPDLLLLRP